MTGLDSSLVLLNVSITTAIKQQIERSDMLDYVTLRAGTSNLVASLITGSDISKQPKRLYVSP